MDAVYHIIAELRFRRPQAFVALVGLAVVVVARIHRPHTPVGRGRAHIELLVHGGDDLRRFVHRNAEGVVVHVAHRKLSHEIIERFVLQVGTEVIDRNIRMHGVCEVGEVLGKVGSILLELLAGNVLRSLADETEQVHQDGLTATARRVPVGVLVVVGERHHLLSAVGTVSGEHVTKADNLVHEVHVVELLLLLSQPLVAFLVTPPYPAHVVDELNDGGLFFHGFLPFYTVFPKALVGIQLHLQLFLVLRTGRLVDSLRILRFHFRQFGIGVYLEVFGHVHRHEVGFLQNGFPVGVERHFAVGHTFRPVLGHAHGFVLEEQVVEVLAPRMKVELKVGDFLQGA